MPRDNAASAPGYEAERLDQTIETAIDRLSRVVVDLERVRGALEPQLDEVRKRLTAALATGNVADPMLMANAGTLIEWLERFARTGLNLAKLTDETTRLRSFVAGGADSRPDLSSMSEIDLQKLVNSAATGK